jgi:hypothetical protein
MKQAFSAYVTPFLLPILTHRKREKSRTMASLKGRERSHTMGNKLSDLTDHLFAQLDRLSSEELHGEKLAEEMSRAKAVACVATQIINTGQLALKAKEFELDYGGNKNAKMPTMLEG